MDPRRRRADVAFLALAVGAAALALVSPALAPGQGLFPVGSLWRVPPWNMVLPPTPGNGLLSDQLLNFWPWRLFLRSELLQGRFPLWNPLSAAGVPFAGCVQAAPFYPTTFLLAVLSPAAWSVIAAWLKLFCAGLFTALHARRLGADKAGAALAGVSFALCGFMVAWIGHPHTNAAALLPLLFWSLGRAFERGAPRDWVPVSVAVGLILLGGHPPTALHVLAAGAAYVSYLSWSRRAGPGPAALSFLAGAALAAPALLPYLEYLRLSSTAAASAGLARWGAHLAPWSLLHLVMPLASGSPGRGAEVLGPAAFGLPPSSNFVERAGWVGVIALAFAGLAVLRRGRDKEVRFHATLALFGLAAALGAAPLPWIWRHLPGFASANPSRLLLLFGFGTATLAGLGCRRDDAPAPRRGLLGFAAASTCILVLYMGAAAGVWRGLSPAEQADAAGRAAEFAVECAAALWLLARPGARRWAPLAAAAFLLRVGIGVNPAAPAGLLYPRTRGIDALAALQGEGRVFGLGAALAPDTGVALGLNDARGRDFTSLRRYEEVVTGRSGDFDFFEASPGLPAPTRLLALSALAATPLTAAAAPRDWTRAYEGEMLVLRAPVPGRRALFVPAAASGESRDVLERVRAPGFDPSATVWLDDGAAPAGAGARGTARILSETPGEVVVETDATGPGWLLLLDNWYPGWRVAVDGRPRALRRADYSFRAVEVPAGRSVARFRYVPDSLRLGLILAALSAVGLAAAWRRRTA
jgi:hypothetical protein